MPQSKEEKQFWDNIQGLINNYMHARYEKKDIERVKNWMQIAMTQFGGIGRNDAEKQDNFLNYQMNLLEKMRKCIATKNTGEPLKKLVKQYIDGFKDFIL